jgi:catechol 2,3-dioxygenase-like lactoylglutathione lyase family enzyme
MTAQATTQLSPLITGAEPQIFVTDVEAALAFYVGKLGFDVAFAYGEPPSYAQVFRGGARLNLRHVDGPVFDAGFRDGNEDAVAVTLTLEDAAPLYAEYQAAGLAFHQPLRTEPWGARTFIVADPDGNLILFAGGRPAA